LLAAGLALLTLSGCATTKQAYDWGEYDQLLYETYKEPTRAEALRLELETHIAALEAGNGKVPPGLYAELGTLYLEAGDSDGAIAMYEKERAAWPESRGLMTALIVNLQRRKAGAEEAAQ
jgi:hypothetical protein